MGKHRVVSLLVLLGSLFTCRILFCQATATISGTVRDNAGAVLANSEVVVLNQGTGIARKVLTDAEGRYTVPSLVLGTYRVSAAREGFQTEARAGIMLTVGREAVVDLALSVGALNQTIEVKGDAPLVESTSASLGSLVDDKTIRALPLNGRSWDQLALLQPDVAHFAPGNIVSGVPLNAGTSARISVGGQRNGTNSVLLDGTDINDQTNGTPGGASGTILGVDAILEFKVFTSSFLAEYGHASGSVISAVTRSGSNEFHGTAFEYLRNSDLDARNFFDVGHAPPPFKRNQFGGVLGGPIHRDKTFFFASYEGLRQGLGTTLTAYVPTDAARQGILPTGTVSVNPAVVPFLNFYPRPNGVLYGNATGQYISAPVATVSEDNAVARVDQQLSPNQALFARVSFDRDYVNAPLSLPHEVQSTTSPQRVYSTVQLTSIFGPHLANNLSAAFNRSYSTFVTEYTDSAADGLSFIPGQPFGTIQFGGTTSAAAPVITPTGNNGNAASYFAYNVFQGFDNITYTRGSHTFKAGFNVERIQDNYTNAGMATGSYTFTSLTTFLQGTPSTLQSTFPVGVTPNWGLRQTLFGAFIQDDYKVNSRLTLNLGLRWEAPTDPTEVNGRSSILPNLSATSMVPSKTFITIDKINFEPRIGLAWRLNDSGKTVIRAGAGIYQNQVLPWLYWGETRTPPYFATATKSNPPFPNGAASLSLPGTLTLAIMSPVVKTPTTYQWNFSIQQEVASHTVFQVAYSGNRSEHLETQSEQDTPIPAVLANGQLYYAAGLPRRNTAWNGIRYYQTDGNSDYNSLAFSLRRQFSSGFEGQIFYTFAKAMDNASGTATGDSLRSPSAVMDPWDRNRDWSLSDTNQANAVGFSFSYHDPLKVNSKIAGALVNNWILNGIGTFTTGQPFTAVLAAAVSQSSASVLAERPNLNAGASQNPTHGITAGCAGIPAGQALRTATRFYDPCGFSLPAAGTYGNLGRNTLIAPGVADVDLALEKAFVLHERTTLTFRYELFNIMNHTNLGMPNNAPLTAAGAPNPTAGSIIYTTTTSRQTQFALRLEF